MFGSRFHAWNGIKSPKQKRLELSFILRVLENDEVVAIFNEQQYAQDFIAYEKTISDKQFEIEKVDLKILYNRNWS